VGSHITVLVLQYIFNIYFIYALIFIIFVILQNLWLVLSRQNNTKEKLFCLPPIIPTDS